MQQSILQYKRAKHRFYKDASIWCYKHKMFENILLWAEHNDTEEFDMIIDTLTPKILTRKIGDIEFAILLEEGLICPDTNLPKLMRDLIPSIIDRLLKAEGIYKLPET